MRPFRFSLHPILLVLIGAASGALALGASTLGPRVEGLAALLEVAKPASLRDAGIVLAADGPLPRRSLARRRRYRWFPALYIGPKKTG